MAYKIFKWWVLFGFLTTAMCGLVYLVAQQSLRQNANNPQIQMAEDAAMALQRGVSTTNVIPPAPTTFGATGTIDVAGNLDPYLIIFDASGDPIAGNATLNGALPQLPAGVFLQAQSLGETRFTWQPEPGVRSAVVLVAVQNSSAGFVMAGRSLREVEIQEDQAGYEVAMAWIVTVVGTFLLLLIFGVIEHEHERRKRKRS